MTVVLVDPTDYKRKYYVVDQTNKVSYGWCPTLDNCLNNLKDEGLSDLFFTESIEWFRNRYPEYTCYYLDEPDQPYEYW